MNPGSDYQAHTTVCVDLGAHGVPVTTLGLKLIDAHVTDLEGAFGLVENFWNSGDDNIALKEAMKTWGQDFQAPSGATAVAIVHLNHSDIKVPLAITSADLAMGDRSARKRFRSLELHGNGTGTFRVYCDGRYISKQTVDATQTPSWARKMNLPRGTTGYCLRFEITGDMDVTGIVANFSPLPGLQ